MSLATSLPHLTNAEYRGLKAAISVVFTNSLWPHQGSPVPKASQTPSQTRNTQLPECPVQSEDQNILALLPAQHS